MKFRSSPANRSFALPSKAERKKQRERNTQDVFPTSPPVRQRINLAVVFIPMVVFAVTGYFANQQWGILARLGPLDHAVFPICSASKRITCVVDGDTVWLRGEMIRLSGVDAPEVTAPQCGSEAARADRATRRLQHILSTNSWAVSRTGKDRFGRTLARFWIGESTAGSMLVEEGLARPGLEHGESWCS